MPSSNQRGVPFLLVVGILLVAGGALWYALQSFSPNPAQGGTTSDSRGQPTPLHEHAAGGDLPALRSALASGSRPDTPADFLGSSGVTPLMVAAQRGQGECLASLLDAKANPNARSRDGLSALMFAAGWGGQGCVRPLLAAGASVDARDDAGRTALMLAATRGDAESLRSLLDAGADIHARNKWGQTALHMGVDGQSASKVALLLERGADANSPDHDGRTALSKAAAQAGANEESAKIISTLLRSGANVSLPDVEGVTPLMYAAREGDLARVVTLLNAGAVSKSLDRAGRSAADWAKERDTPDADQIAQLLREAAGK